MQRKLVLSFVTALVYINQRIQHVSSTGSITTLTNNGFPSGFLDSIVNNDIVRNKLKSRWRWEVWDVVPGTHTYNIYIFNITNPNEVEKGGKPILHQLGPYVYAEHRIKFNVTIDLEMRVNYERDFSYTFDKAQSAGSEDDLINAMNIPLIIFSKLVSKGPDPAAGNAAVNDLVSGGETLVKKKVKVGDLIFNAMDVSKYTKYVDLMGPSSPTVNEFKNGSYAVLKLKSGHHEGAYTVDSGLKDTAKVGQIITWNYMDKLNYWSGDYCNTIRGTEGSVFGPNIENKDILHILELDFCRTISLKYQGPTNFRSIQTDLFTPVETFLEDPRVNKDNLCFCKDPGTKAENCLKKGVTDVSPCRDGAPLVMSFPHFLDADEEYLKNVTGLDPSVLLHGTTIDVEPVTGSVVRWHKKFQTNVWLKPIANIDFFKHVPAIVVPILWNDDVFSLTDDKAELLVEELASQGGGRGNGNIVYISRYLLLFVSCLYYFTLY